MPDLKLLALDADDLAVLSAHLQDAVIRVGEAAYLKGERRFAALVNRFDWERALASEGSKKPDLQRRRSGLRFERVRGVQVHGFDQSRKDAALELLALTWEQEGEGPGGHIVLQFAGGGAIRLDVECIEIELRDLGAAWAAKSRPRHPAEPGKPSK